MLETFVLLCVRVFVGGGEKHVDFINKIRPKDDQDQS